MCSQQQLEVREEVHFRAAVPGGRCSSLCVCVCVCVCLHVQQGLRPRGRKIKRKSASLDILQFCQTKNQLDDGLFTHTGTSAGEGSSLVTWTKGEAQRIFN